MASPKKVARRLGKKIARARKELGYRSQKELGRAVDLPYREISRIEKGEVLPPIKLVVFLCGKMGIPVRAFVYQNVEDRAVLFRCGRQKGRLPESVKGRIGVIKDLLETLMEFGAIEPPGFHFKGDPDPELAAREFVSAYGLKDQDFNTWEVLWPVLAENGVYVFAMPLPRGSAIVHKENPFFIILNSDEPYDRWSFSLLHEIGHLVAPKEEKENENYADVFAREVLIPERLRARLWKRLGKYVRNRWFRKFYEEVRATNPFVSPESVFFTLVRTFEGNFGKFGQFKKFCREERARERWPEQGKVLYPRKIMEKLRELLEEGKITEGRYQELVLS